MAHLKVPVLKNSLLAQDNPSNTAALKLSKISLIEHTGQATAHPYPKPRTVDTNGRYYLRQMPQKMVKP